MSRRVQCSAMVAEASQQLRLEAIGAEIVLAVYFFYVSLAEGL